MKIVTNRKVELVSENEFSKIFNSEGIEVYMHKAFDEDSNKHYIIAGIPEIKEVNASAINYPFEFETSDERDNAFNIFDTYDVAILLDYLVNFITEQKEKQENK